MASEAYFFGSIVGTATRVCCKAELIGGGGGTQRGMGNENGGSLYSPL